MQRCSVACDFMGTQERFWDAYGLRLSNMAGQVLEELKALAHDKLLRIAVAAVLKRGSGGKATLRKTNDFTGESGAVVGAVGMSRVS
jgi:hypothetical protein